MTGYKVRTRVAAPIPDAPGYDLKPHPEHATTAAEFMRSLRDLRVWAGEPSPRELSRRCGRSPSKTTFWKMLRSDELPQLDLLVVFIEALGMPGDVEEWRNAWRRLRLTAVNGTGGDR